jgi:hypothetical protein
LLKGRRMLLQALRAVSVDAGRRLRHIASFAVYC